MTRLAIRALAVAAAASAAASLPAFAPEPSSAAGSAATVFKGRFVCGDEPLAGARVELRGGPRASSSGGGIFGLFGLGLDEHVAYTVRDTAYTTSQGDWSFTVPRTKSTNYFLVATLDDGRGTIITRSPSPDPIAAVPGAGGTNFDDVPLHDYHTQAYPGAECALWLALEDAYHAYARLMGKRPPYGGLVAQYDAPNRGMPYTAYTTIVWPRDYPVSDAAALHEFAHTIRNASLGSESAFLDEVSQEDYRLRGDPCRRTTPQYAFHEGWAEFWARDFAPAPNCSGVKPDASDVEGNVAWALTRLEHNCAAAGRKRMVEVLLAKGSTIHSLADLVRALGVGSASCLGTPLDPASIPRTKATPPVSDELWMRDLRAGLTATRHRESQLGALLPGADHAAVSARCPVPPCLQAIGRKLAPSLIRGQVAQAHAVASTLQTQLSIDATSVRGAPARRFLDSVITTPRTLRSKLAKIGVDSIDKALAAARPLATRDHSPRTRSLLDFFRSQRAALVHAARAGAGHAYQKSEPGGCNWFLCWAGWSEAAKKTSTVPTVFTHEVTFNRFASGTVITTQTAKDGATFGSATALAFRGALPKYVCPAGPTASGDWAIAPACNAPDPGFSYSGTLARLTFPARSVRVAVGATQAVPGGLAAELDGFDAAGAIVSRTAVLVGSSTNGGEAYEGRLLTLLPPLTAHAIAFVALYVNHPISSLVGLESRPQPGLAFADLRYEEKRSR
jgi:hypothetical protein